MADERDEWYQRMKSVEREYQAARFAVDRALQQINEDHNLLTGDLRVRELERASEWLEDTYLLRLFAEFESGLRVFFQRIRHRRGPSRTEDLMNSIAAMRSIQGAQLASAHRVREYRNSLIHERDQPVDPLSIVDARRYLFHYFSFLPLHW